MRNPYDEFIEDEASGIKVPSELYKAWQQGAETTAEEIKGELENFKRIHGKDAMFPEGWQTQYLNEWHKFWEGYGVK